MSILVDTDWIIDGLIGRPDALLTLSKLGPLGLAVSAVTVGEVFEGAYDRAFAPRFSGKVTGIRTLTC
jgi:predicted nucleic acid-binding protein